MRNDDDDDKIMIMMPTMIENGDGGKKADLSWSSKMEAKWSELHLSVVPR